MDDHKERLKRLLVRYALKNSSRILLSGQISSCFIEVRRVTLSSVGAYLVGQVFLDKLQELDLHPKAVGGTEAATAIAVAVSRSSYDLPPNERMDVYTLRRRKDRTFHNQGSQVIDGFQQKDSVVIVEDVTTNGVITLNTVQKIKTAGLKVKAVVTLVDREEGAVGLINPFCPFYSVFTASELFRLKEELSTNFEYHNEESSSGSPSFEVRQ